MKRNLLLLAVMILTVCLYSVGMAQCPQDVKDNGVCDTLYMQVWPVGNNPTFDTPGPDFALIPFYMTHDVPSDLVDSIAGVVIPVCYYKATNATKYCSLTAYWNNVNMSGANYARSIFRALGTEMTWMKELYDDPNGPYDWSNKIINLDGTSHFWLSLIPTTQPLVGTVNHKLTATMTFKLEDSMTICIDSCFWPPSSRVAFSRMDAVTYIPRMSWKDANGVGVMCHSFYIVPNLPPVFRPDGCPNTQVQHANGSYTATGIAVDDPDCPAISTLNSLQASFIGGGVTLGGFVPAFTSGGCSYVGALQYTVTDHCAAGGSVMIIATDNLGAADTCFFGINFTNGAPDITCPGAATIAYNGTYSGTATATDPDADALTFSGDPSNPSGLVVAANGAITWSPGSCGAIGDHTITVKVTDACGATDVCTFVITVKNDAPTCTLTDLPPSMTINQEVTVHFTYTDAQGTGTVTVVAAATCGTISDLTYAGGSGMFKYKAPAVGGPCQVCLTVTDECQATSECCDDVDIFAAANQVVIPNKVYERFGFGHWDYTGTIVMDDACPPWNGINPGDFFEIPILLNAFQFQYPIGGFELEVEFDYIDLTFYGAMRGKLLENRVWQQGVPPGDSTFWSWEYFSYRVLPCPLCACCKYKILLFGQADMPDGNLRKGYCLQDGGPAYSTYWGVDYTDEDQLIGASLVWLKFQVANNELLRDLKLPVFFEWEHKLSTSLPYHIIQDWDCAENTFSNCDGSLLYVSKDPMQYDPTICPSLVANVLDFVNGGVHICSPCTAFTCIRGDINMDSVTYSVADAVLFARYFVSGIGVFIVDRDEQVCATDINADGRTLMLSDLIYLIRVILHDAVEFPGQPKLTPDVANVIVSNNTIITECASPIGAILFEFDGAVNPTLLATNMEIVAGANKVLVYMNPVTGASIEGTTEVLSANSKLLSVTAVDRDGRDLKITITAKAAPTAFALNQAYPNPFNPYTNLSFTLPEASNYSLKVYNVAGQLVRSYDGLGQVGLNMVTWDGKDNSGVSVASGVYFYKLTAGKFTATEKMVMMK